MNVLLIGLLATTIHYAVIDNATISIGINNDSNIYVENYLLTGGLDLNIYLDIYIDYELYGEPLDISIYKDNFDFKIVNDIVIDAYYISIDNNWLNIEGDILINTLNGTDYNGFQASLNLYEDYVYQEDVYLGEFNTTIYDADLFNDFYELGYSEGYEIGLTEGQGVNNVITWFGSIWDGLARILGLEIAPNLTIGTIITIPIVIAVLFFGLKALIQ